jgi:hypothetical protein
VKKGDADSLGRIADVLLEHDPRVLRIVGEEQDVDPECVGGRREIEDGAELCAAMRGCEKIKER